MSVSAARRASGTTWVVLAEADSAATPSYTTASCRPRLTGSAAPASAVLIRQSRKACLCCLTNWATWGISSAASTAALWNGHPRRTVASSDSSGGRWQSRDASDPTGRAVLARDPQPSVLSAPRRQPLTISISEKDIPISAVRLRHCRPDRVGRSLAVAGR